MSGVTRVRSLARAGKADDSVDNALAIMRELRVRRLPVVVDGNNLAGVVSTQPDR